jgi:hypothetical protein
MTRAHAPLLRAALAALLLTWSSACVQLIGPPGVAISSQPPGARVLVDGRDSGFVTPCNLDISRRSHRIELVKAGYRSAVIQVEGGGQNHVVPWEEAWVNYQTWHFPLWLNAVDGLMPYKIDRSYSPARIHVPLQLASIN